MGGISGNFVGGLVSQWGTTITECALSQVSTHPHMTVEHKATTNRQTTRIGIIQILLGWNDYIVYICVGIRTGDHRCLRAGGAQRAATAT